MQEDNGEKKYNEPQCVRSFWGRGCFMAPPGVDTQLMTPAAARELDQRRINQGLSPPEVKAGIPRVRSKM